MQTILRFIPADPVARIALVAISFLLIGRCEMSGRLEKACDMLTSISEDFSINPILAASLHERSGDALADVQTYVRTSGELSEEDSRRGGLFRAWSRQERAARRACSSNQFDGLSSE